MIAKRRPPAVVLEPFKDRPDLITDPVFLIGNGTSRKNFDLERLRGIGTIIGCNALYREFTPDLLVAIDSKMLTEIKKAEYEGTVMIPKGRRIVIPGALIWVTKRFNTSGCFAMQMISEKMKPIKCYMLGMDGFSGNIYDKTINYAANTLQNFTGILKYYIIALQNSENTVFINVNDKDAWTQAARDSGSYECISYKEFEMKLNELRN